MVNAERRIEIVKMLKAGKGVREIQRVLHCESSEIAQVRRDEMIPVPKPKRGSRSFGMIPWLNHKA